MQIRLYRSGSTLTLFDSLHNSINEISTQSARHPKNSEIISPSDTRKLCKSRFLLDNRTLITWVNSSPGFSTPRRGSTQKKLQACKNLSKNWHFIIIHLFLTSFNSNTIFFFSSLAIIMRKYMCTILTSFAVSGARQLYTQASSSRRYEKTKNWYFLRMIVGVMWKRACVRLFPPCIFQRIRWYVRSRLLVLCISLAPFHVHLLLFPSFSN